MPPGCSEAAGQTTKAVKPGPGTGARRGLDWLTVEYGIY
jgi:hypothetical protein